MNINITKQAWNKINTILTKSNNSIGLLYYASSGGCNGFNFNLDLLSKNEHNSIIKNKYYTILENDNSKVYIDPLSELYLSN